jgi:nitrous oxidase accessory protein NosD
VTVRRLSAALLLAAATAAACCAAPAAPASDPIPRLAAGATLDLRGEHVLTAPLVVPPHAHLRGPAVLRAAPQAQLSHLVELGDGATLEDIHLDGAGLAAPPTGWTEQTGAPRGIGVLIAGTAAEPVRQARVLRCRFAGFPGGGVFARHTADVLLQDLQAERMQQAAPQETCAVFAFYDSTRPQIIGCRITGYHWKGFYFKHCTAALARDAFAANGPPDHASHYARFSQDVTFRGGGATDAFGVKTFGSARVQVEGMTFLRAPTGVFIDATSDADVVRNRITDSTRQGVIVGSEEGHPPSRAVRVQENTIATTHADATPSSSGVQLVALGAGRAVTDVEISHNEISGYLWGISFLPGSGLRYEDVRITENRLAALRQYGVVGPVDHLQLRRNRIELEGPLAQNFVAVWPATRAESAIELTGNVWIGLRDFGLELGRPDGKFSRVNLEDNRHALPRP